MECCFQNCDPYCSFYEQQEDCDKDKEEDEDLGIENGDMEGASDDGFEEPVANCDDMNGPDDPCRDDPFDNGDMDNDREDDGSLDLGGGDNISNAFSGDTNDGVSDPDEDTEEPDIDPNIVPVVVVVPGKCYEVNDDGVLMEIDCPDIDYDTENPGDDDTDIPGLDPDSVIPEVDPVYDKCVDGHGRIVPCFDPTSTHCYDPMTGDPTACNDTYPHMPHEWPHVPPPSPEPVDPDKEPDGLDELSPEPELPPPGPVFGCTDPLSGNYNPLATHDDGTCAPLDPEGGGPTFVEPIEPINTPLPEPADVDTDEDPEEPDIVPDNNPILLIPGEGVKGCMNPDALNYNPDATIHVKESCVYGEQPEPPPKRCRTDSGDWICPGPDPELPEPEPPGPEPEPEAPLQWDPNISLVGCNDPTALNYNPNATFGNKDSCVYPDNVPEKPEDPDIDPGLLPVDPGDETPEATRKGPTECEQELIRLINEYRSLQPVPLQPLKWNEIMADAAKAQAAVNHDRVSNGDTPSHVGTDGSTHVQRLNDLGYPGGWILENLGAVVDSTGTGPADHDQECEAKKQIDQWKDSPAHNANLLDGNSFDGAVKFVGGQAILVLGGVGKWNHDTRSNEYGSIDPDYTWDKPEAPRPEPEPEPVFEKPEHVRRQFVDELTTAIGLARQNHIDIRYPLIVPPTGDHKQNEAASMLLDDNLKNDAPFKPDDALQWLRSKFVPLGESPSGGVIALALDPSGYNSGQNVARTLLEPGSDTYEVLTHPTLNSISVAWKAGSDQEQLVIIVTNGDTSANMSNHFTDLSDEYNDDPDKYCAKYGCRDHSGVATTGSNFPVWGCPGGSALDSRPS